MRSTTNPRSNIVRQLSLRKPSSEICRRFIAAQAELPFTYAAVGATAATPPADYVLDHTRIRLGEGEAVYLAAKAALERWEQFHLGWCDASAPSTPIRTGEVVAVMAHAFGFWWLNACRIVYTVEESVPIRRFGFAYGTLPGHMESGEERFQIEWDRGDDGVWYDLLAFSKPNHFLAKLGYPMIRRLQKRFARDSGASMVRAMQGLRG